MSEDPASAKVLAATHSTLTPYLAIPLVIVVLGLKFVMRRRNR
jgi:hypothetical protein